MQEKYDHLMDLLKELRTLGEAIAVLFWDRATYMPAKGGKARGDQIAMLSRMRHERQTDDAMGKLLEDLKSYEADLDDHSVEAANIRLARYHYEQATKIPKSLVQKISEDGSESFMAWTKARPANDFEAMIPHLEVAVENARTYAECFAPYDHIFDPFVAGGNYGLNTAQVREVFAQLRAATVELLEKIRVQSQVDNSILYGDFPKQKQYDFARKVVTEMGYDFERGRLDETYHPFAIPLAHDDVRITTRGNDTHLGDGLFATIHEAGHGMHRQGMNPAVLAFPYPAAGVAESESRLWENRIARSRDFWALYYDTLQAMFPALADVDVEDFYKAINKVQGSLIRVQADELTYNLHIMIRTELEIQLLEGELAVKDLADAWNSMYESDLGIFPPDHTDGILQDTHWYRGTIGGAFVGYTIGNILSTQYYDAALKADAGIASEVNQGNYKPLFDWLHENVWMPSSMYDTLELTKRITGEGINPQPLIDYLNAKFGDIYGL